jgi:hypothetical protein
VIDSSNGQDPVDKTGQEIASDKNVDTKLKPPVISTKALLVMVSVAVVLVGALGVLAYNNYRDGKSVQVASSPEPSKVLSIEVNSPQSLEKVVDEGVTWQTPEKLDDQKFFELTKDSICDSNAFNYYKVGSISTGGIIIDSVANCGMGGSFLFRMIKNGETARLITQNSSSVSGEFSLTKSVQLDNSFVFKSLSTDKVISKDQTDLVSVQNPKFSLETNQQATTKKVSSTKWGDLYLEKTNTFSANDINKESSDKTPIVSVARYYIKLNDSSEINYEVRPKFLRDDNTLNLQFKASGLEGKKYEKFETGGCGLGLGSFPYIVDSESLSGNEEIGSSEGSTVYTIKQEDNKTLDYAYMLYKSDQAQNKASKQDFINNYGFIYWTDAYGSPIGYLLSDYKPAMECGKPVVYLYPTQKTDFKVSVGADVTKSEPIYNRLWKGTAYPGGKLVVDGKDYPNLFWEGKGYGAYPKIDFGRVILTKNAKSEISSDLKKMNLNDQEIGDFLDYWLVKMPKTTYTRISWLTNKEMDALAPLSISPKPDSVIRVFLDFGGLSQPTSLVSQNLPRVERAGFAVVEWGGLLRGQ